MGIYDNMPPAYESVKSMNAVWWTDFYEMDAIWRVMGGVLDGVMDGVDRIAGDAFVETADAQTIARMEAFLYITDTAGKTLDERRAVVAGLIKGSGHIGEQEIIDYVSLFTTGSVDVEFAQGGVITVTITRDVSDKAYLTSAMYVLNKRIPAHLRLVFEDTITPITLETVERFRLYSVSTVEETRFDGTFPFDGSIRFSGRRTIQTDYFEDGDMWSTITNKRMELLAAASRGDTLPAVTQVAFGDGGADAGGNPINPTPAQTALSNELGRYDIDTIEAPEFNISRYGVTIPAGDLGGALISEAGLYDADGNLVAVKNMPPREKEVDLQMVYSFDDLFTNE